MWVVDSPVEPGGAGGGVVSVTGGVVVVVVASVVVVAPPGAGRAALAPDDGASPTGSPLETLEQGDGQREDERGQRGPEPSSVHGR